MSFEADLFDANFPRFSTNFQCRFHRLVGTLARIRNFSFALPTVAASSVLLVE